MMKIPLFVTAMLVSLVTLNVNLDIVKSTWTTPVDIYSSCNSSSVSESIDDNLFTGFQHDQGHLHYAIYDMDETYQIMRTRYYSDPLENYNPCRVLVYVSDNPDSMGSAVDDCIFTIPSEDWQICDNTDKNGRYVKIELGVNLNMDCTAEGILKYLFEFDADIEEIEIIDEFKICLKLKEDNKILCKIPNETDLEYCERLDDNLCEFDDNTYGLVIEI